ncbi:MAG: molybdopterin/thiamine biosynthesis adenylyltransferase [Cellvibrionaceae bacterium]|jgi:molybdopterin/thiamine biosynthesis adenylyltransferase
MTETLVITDPDTDRYHTFSYISWWKQEVVRDATALVVGAGALGNEVIKNLALMGIGHLVIADFDTIEDSNLSRSILFRASDRGRRKVDAAAERVREINPDVKVMTWHGNINHGLGTGIFRNVDVIIGCLDNREARLSIDRFAMSVGRPWVDGAIQELMGICRVFWPSKEGANYECTLTERDYQLISLRYSCPILARENVLQGKVPTTPTSASIVAAFQTQEALKIIHDMEIEPGKALLINGLTNDVYKTEYPVIEDRIHPPLEPIIELKEARSDQITLADLLAIAKRELGDGAVLEFSTELIISMTDPSTGETEPVFKRMVSLTENSLTGTGGAQKQMELTYRITGEEDFLDKTLAEIDQPPMTIIRARNGEKSAYLEITGDAEWFFDYSKYE